MITITGTPKSQSNTGIVASLSLNQFAKPSSAIGVSFDGALKTSKEHNCSESFQVRYAHQRTKRPRCVTSAMTRRGRLRVTDHRRDQSRFRVRSIDSLDLTQAAPCRADLRRHAL
jgi:hypothetical protein